jgi:hypothetical protein
MKLRSLSLREEYRVRAFENRGLTGIFGPRRDEIWGWMNCINCTPHHIIRMMKLRRMGWTGHVAHVGGTTNAYWVLVEKSEGITVRRLG